MTTNHLQLTDDEVRLLEAVAANVMGENELQSLVYGVVVKLRAFGLHTDRKPYHVVLSGTSYRVCEAHSEEELKHRFPFIGPSLALLSE